MLLKVRFGLKSEKYKSALFKTFKRYRSSVVTKSLFTLEANYYWLEILVTNNID